MRTTLELPDALFKHLKTLAAMEGTSLRELVIRLLERGLQVPSDPAQPLSALPSVSLGDSVALKPSEFTNASLASFNDE